MTMAALQGFWRPWSFKANMRRHVLKSPEIQHIILHLFKNNTRSLHHMGYIHLVGKKFTGWKNKFFFFFKSPHRMRWPSERLWCSAKSFKSLESCRTNWPIRMGSWVSMDGCWEWIPDFLREKTFFANWYIIDTVHEIRLTGLPLDFENLETISIWKHHETVWIKIRPTIWISYSFVIFFSSSGSFRSIAKLL